MAIVTHCWQIELVLAMVLLSSETRLRCLSGGKEKRCVMQGDASSAISQSQKASELKLFDTELLQGLTHLEVSAK